MKRLATPLALVFLFSVAGSARAAEDLTPLLKQAFGLKPTVLQLAMNAAKKAEDKGLVQRRDLLTVIDYSIPSSQPRLFVFDLAAKKLLFRELVAHGKNR